MRNGRIKKINESELMEKILEIRDSNLEEEKQLCKELLSISELNQDTYGRAFAYVYLFDSVLALGDYSSCNQYLSQAIYLCREYEYDNLLMMLCNFAGLYYLKLNDEQTALQYYLEGLEIAKNLNDYDTGSKIYNNIGLCFGGRNDWNTANSFFEKAYMAIKDHVDEFGGNRIISYLSNLAESYIQMGNTKKAYEILKLCASFLNDEAYYKIRIGCGWVSYYAKKGDKEKCLSEVKKLFDLDVQNFENKYFICDMLEQLFEDMMNIGEHEWARKFYQIIDDLADDIPLIVRYRVQCAKIRFMEFLDNEEEPNEIYLKYYELFKEMSDMDNSVRAQSMLSRIELNNILHEREEMRLEKAILEDAVQLDELTKLYNRRYFNKLASKVMQNMETKTLGVIMVDVDYFKQYNDCYGHIMGDQALKQVGKVLSDNASDGIYVSRYGGDEFVCLCQNVSDIEVDKYVEAVHKGILLCKIPHEESKCEKILTLSIGYFNDQFKQYKNIDSLLKIPDNALYKAKKLGRNCFYKKI